MKTRPRFFKKKWFVIIYLLCQVTKDECLQCDLIWGSKTVQCFFFAVVKMNGKLHSETGAFSSDDMRAEILNPFVHKLELDNTYDKIKVREATNALHNWFLRLYIFLCSKRFRFLLYSAHACPRTMYLFTDIASNPWWENTQKK